MTQASEWRPIAEPPRPSQKIKGRTFEGAVIRGRSPAMTAQGHRGWNTVIAEDGKRYVITHWLPDPPKDPGK
jgi:hypothetical protein